MIASIRQSRDFNRHFVSSRFRKFNQINDCRYPVILQCCKRFVRQIELLKIVKKCCASSFYGGAGVKLFLVIIFQQRLLIFIHSAHLISFCIYNQCSISILLLTSFRLFFPNVRCCFCTCGVYANILQSRPQHRSPIRHPRYRI